jgi:citrate lyase subunit beta/citryl-CoA lyase
VRWVAPGPAFLFCPADRPDRFEKAARAADVVILDLEDGVSPDRRGAARGALRSADLDPETTVIRLNPVGTDDHARDLDAVRATGVSMVMLAKTSSADDVRSLAPLQVVALCETPGGVRAAAEIAACANTIAVMWGSEDLVASLGGSASRWADGSLRDLARYARAAVLVDAGAHGVGALDTVFLNFGDLEGFRREAEDAAAMGFMATPCIHPSQVAVVRHAYRPTPDQVDFSTRVLAEAAQRGGVFRLGDVMVDGPVIAQARQILRRAGEKE